VGHRHVARQGSAQACAFGHGPVFHCARWATISTGSFARLLSN
jgi:hypothetical protein